MCACIYRSRRSPSWKFFLALAPIRCMEAFAACGHQHIRCAPHVMCSQLFYTINLESKYPPRSVRRTRFLYKYGMNVTYGCNYIIHSKSCYAAYNYIRNAALLLVYVDDETVVTREHAASCGSLSYTSVNNDNWAPLVLL